MEFIDTFDKHAADPGKTIDEYAREKHLELGTYVLSKKVVYLDTKYWLILRDAYEGKPIGDNHKELFATIDRLVKKGVCIFPISEDVFIEVLKQSDPDTLNSTIDLIDRFSGGVTLIGLDARTRLELLQFIDKHTGRSVYEPKDLVWTKLAYVLGSVSPSITGLDDANQQLLGKAFFDQMWFMSLCDMMSFIGENDLEFSSKEEISLLTQKMNRGKFKYQHENRSFKKMFMSEIAGSIDANRELIVEVLKYKYEKDTGNTLSSNDIKTNDGQLICNMIYNLFNLNKIGEELPSFRILSGLHAATRWDKKQKYKDNDMHDYRHAAAAIPYCDFFFTERALTNLTTQNLLAYDKLYNCNIQWKVFDALNSLLKLESQS